MIRRVVCLALLSLAAACSRQRYRESADREVHDLVLEKSNDPRWALRDFTIELDPKSRYFDPTNRDYPPMPPDDPASHQLMVRVDGKAGWAHWEDHGVLDRLDNPVWEKYIGEGMERTPDGKLKLRLEDAVRLAIQHSPSYQDSLEAIYLSALDVSTERYRFDLQFLGGFNANVTHQGSENPGGESTSVGFTPLASVQRKFATAAQLLVDFANTTTWEFFGPNQGFSASQAAFSLVQPLLRGGGRAVALEQLTIAERTLLANLRAFHYYREGFFTLVTIGEQSVAGPQRRGGFFGGTGLTGFTGQGSGGFGGVGDVTGFGRGSLGGGGAAGAGGAGFAGGGAGTVGGFIGLLQQMQQIRNTRDSLNAQLRTLALLESNLDAGLIDIAQVDQFRQNIETERANLLQAQNSLASSLDTFTRTTLGLPPDLPLEPDDSLIRPFQLIDPAMTLVQNAISEFIDEFGELPERPEEPKLREAFQRLEALRAQVAGQLEAVPRDLDSLKDRLEDRQRSLGENEGKELQREMERLRESLDEVRQRFAGTAQSLEQLRAGLNEDTLAKTADGVVELLNELSNIIGELSLIQARSRLETIHAEPVGLTPEAALEVARAARPDWMNNRAALVDTWRLIEFNANALQSTLTVRLSGEISTIGKNNPLRFRDETGTLRAGLEFDGPFTRLVERNNFRQQLIQYQQDRRQLIQFEDAIKQSVRRVLRDLEQLRVNLEIQRRAVTIAIRRVEQTREALNKPVSPSAPGQAPQPLGPTAAQNLLFALSDLRNTQNNLMSVWLNHLASRMRLYREIGIMRIDEHGMWIDEPLGRAWSFTARNAPLPPEAPREWLEMASAGSPPGPQVRGERESSVAEAIETKHGNH